MNFLTVSYLAHVDGGGFAELSENWFELILCLSEQGAFIPDQTKPVWPSIVQSPDPATYYRSLYSF